MHTDLRWKYLDLAIIEILILHRRHRCHYIQTYIFRSSKGSTKRIIIHRRHVLLPLPHCDRCRAPELSSIAYARECQNFIDFMSSGDAVYSYNRTTYAGSFVGGMYDPTPSEHFGLYSAARKRRGQWWVEPRRACLRWSPAGVMWICDSCRGESGSRLGLGVGPIATARAGDVAVPVGAVELEVVTRVVPEVPVTGQVLQEHDVEASDAELGLSAGLLN